MIIQKILNNNQISKIKIATGYWDLLGTKLLLSELNQFFANGGKLQLTTDVLAEGVNLPRANSILNYDSPWNATRLMQRLGRINRIGSKADKIWNYNFYPSTLGDDQINLKNRTYVKLQAFHELFGEDSQIYSTDEKVKNFDKVERESLEDTESPLMPFIAELRDLKENHFEQQNCHSELVSESYDKEISIDDFTQNALVQLEKQINNKIEIDKENDNFGTKVKGKANTKEQNTAIEFTKQLIKQKGFSKEVIKALNNISNMVRNKNSTAIKRMLKLQSNIGNEDLSAKYQKEILQIADLKMTNSKKEYSLAIAMLGE